MLVFVTQVNMKIKIYNLTSLITLKSKVSDSIFYLTVNIESLKEVETMMSYKTSLRRNAKKGNLVITNNRPKYWLEPHVDAYNRLKAISRVRELTEKEEHQYLICLRVLHENNMLREYSY